MKKLIVAIDGPSGAGKSTLSKELSRQLAYLNIDTGAMYRSVALLAQQRRIDPHDHAALEALCADLNIEFCQEGTGERVILNGVDVSTQIRTPEISLLTAEVAACPAVRAAMVRLQRKMGEKGGVVLEGRDIGTVVFPHADVKFFLSASAEERGRRRYEELSSRGAGVTLRQTIAEVEARDVADTQRAHAPLRQASDAVVIDSTQMSIVEVLNRMLKVVRQREQGGTA